MKPPGAVRLHVVPVTRTIAKECVANWHRHNAAPVSMLCQNGAATDDGILVAVGILGLPTGRGWKSTDAADGHRTVEVTRVSADGTPNATSILYAALARVAFGLGYTRVITYTQAGESGASLRGAGWRVIAERPARRGWHTPSRPRDDARYLSGARTLWEAPGPRVE